MTNPIKFSRLAPLIFSGFILASCTTTNYTSLNEANHYKAIARSAVKSPEFNGQVSIIWDQKDQNETNITVQGAFGQGKTDIKITPVVTSITTDGQTYKGESPDELFYALTDFKWPISGTKAWLSGKPADINSATELIYDKQKRLSSFNEAGWHVEYQSWVRKAGLTLPERMTLSRGDDIRLRLLIERWIIQ